MRTQIFLARLLAGTIILALSGAVLSPMGIVHAQCTGSATDVDCTGVDPDGWNAINEAPGAATTLTVHANARVDDRISLDGDDTLIIEAGTQLTTSHDSVVSGSGPNTVHNAGTITFAVGGGIFLVDDHTDGVEIHNSGRINGGRASAGGIAVSGIGQPTLIVNSGWVSAHTGLFFLDNSAPILTINTGTISGTSRGIYSQSTLDILVNSGSIQEYVDLMHENDTFIAAGGTVAGTVLLSAGDDSFTTLGGTVAGRIDGGPGFDTLVFAFDVRDVDYAIVAENLANADPSGDTLTYIFKRFTWQDFELIVNWLNVIPTPGGPAIAPPIPADSRLNDIDLAPGALVYALGGGVAVDTPAGERAISADATTLRAALAEADGAHSAVAIETRLGLTLYALPEAVLLATSPTYAFAFQASRCGIIR